MLMNFGPSLTDSCTGSESLKQEFHCSHVHILICNIQICSTDKQTSTHIRKRRNTHTHSHMLANTHLTIQKHMCTYTPIHPQSHMYVCINISFSHVEQDGSNVQVRSQKGSCFDVWRWRWDGHFYIH